MAFVIDQNEKYFISIDLAKNFFQVCVAGSNGKTLLNKAMTRNKLIEFFMNIPSSTVTMEACASSNFWARLFLEFGHEVRLLNPIATKAFLMGKNKNDTNDAQAIMNASRAENTHFVRIKSVEESILGNILVMRKMAVDQKTQIINQTRSILNEHGIVSEKGALKFINELPCIIEKMFNKEFLYINPNELSNQLIQAIIINCEMLWYLIDIIENYDRQIKSISLESENIQKLLDIPGIGFVTAAATVATIGNGKQFKNGRQTGAFLGLTPGEYSSGGKHSMRGITKRGSIGLRTLLINAANAIIRGLHFRKKIENGLPEIIDNLDRWVIDMLGKKKRAVVVVALANKLARICWHVLTTGENYVADKASFQKKQFEKLVSA